MERIVWALDRAEPIFHDGVIGCDVPDVWHLVASKLDGSDILKLAATSQFFWKTLSESHVWKKALLRKLQLPDSPPTNIISFPWFTLYARNFDGTHLFTNNGAVHLNWLGRLGGFVLEQEEAILAWDLLKFKQGSKQEKLEALLRAENFKDVENMKPGIWIADLHEVRCFCGEQGCTRRMKSFDVRHIDLFASSEFIDGPFFFITITTGVVKKVDVQAPGVVTAAVIGSCRKDANLEVFKDWDEGVQYMVTSNGVTVKVFVEQEQPDEEQFHASSAIRVQFNKVISIDNKVMAIDVSRVT